MSDEDASGIAPPFDEPAHANGRTRIGRSAAACRARRRAAATSRSRRAGARPSASRRLSAARRTAAASPTLPAADAGDFLDRERGKRPTQARLVGQDACWATRARRRMIPKIRPPVFGHDHARAMKSAWVERDAKTAVDRYGQSRHRRRPGAAHLFHAPARPRRQARAAWRRQYLAEDHRARPRRRGGRGAARQRLRLRTWARSSPPVFRRCGSSRCARLRARKALSTTPNGAGAARLSDRSAGALAVGRDAAARLHAGEIRRPHPCDRGAEPDRPAGREKLCAEVYGGRLGFVPYLMPGFGLAKKTAEVFEQNPKVEGLILDKHGIFTFGERRARGLRAHDRFRHAARKTGCRKIARSFAERQACHNQLRPRSDVAPILRGACTLRDADGEGAHQRPILEFRASDAILNFVNGKDVARYARAGVITPDHVHPHQALAADRAGAASRQARRSSKRPRTRPRRNSSPTTAAYFARNNKRANGAAMHDPAPRVVLVPGARPVRHGRKRQGRARRRRHRGSRGRGHHRRRSDRAFHVDLAKPTCSICEYWPLELAKLGARKILPLAGQVAVITGAGGAIGAATAQRLRGGRRRSGAARSRCQGRAGKGQGHRRRRACASHAT